MQRDHRYLPMTDHDRQEMLHTIGVSDVEELFQEIPQAIRLQGLLNVEQALSEPELVRFMKQLSNKNLTFDQAVSFMGAGMYEHYIPSVVSHLTSRSEFYTAYTPYQPEISQGELQGIFEFQSMICELTGMEASNSSMYDGPTAVAEAAIMAVNATRKKKVVISAAVHPETRMIVNTYLRSQGIEVVEVPFGMQPGQQVREAGFQTSVEALDACMDEDTAAFIVQHPNFFGVLENVQELASIAHEKKALTVGYVNPMSLGLLQPPGDWGADIACGDAQPFGIPVAFGGPSCGFIATKNAYVRKLPGRIVGQTEDAEGKRGFVLTLQAREQHIRREKASSNICSNQALNALAVAVYLSTMGKQGIVEVAKLNLQKAHYALQQLTSVPGVERMTQEPFFNEFVIRLPRPVDTVVKALVEEGFLPGYPLHRAYPVLKNQLLVAVTEIRTKEEMDCFAEKLEGLL